MQKVINSLLLLLMAFLLHACQDDAPPGDLFPVYLPGNTDNGEMSAIKSLTDWRASAQATYLNGFPDYLEVDASTYTEEEYLRESLWFIWLPIRTGTFEIRTYDQTDTLQYQSVRANYATSTADGDASEDYYQVDTTAMDNFITLTRVDTIAKEVEGYFTCSFEIATFGGKRNPLNPDRLKFSYGRFKVKITN